MRTLIGIARLLIFLTASLFTLMFQSTLMLFTRGPVALVYPRLFHAFCTRLFGIKVLVEGEIEEGPGIVYVGNHISYLDIPIIGGLIKGCFVAKKEVEDWPFFGVMGKMGQTVYISRKPADAGKETKTLLSRLEEGLPLIIFPEGTSSDGTKIFPFKSSSFEIFLNKNIKIKPFTISVMEVNGQRALTQRQRNLYAWHGDMTLLPHLWSVAKGKGAIVKVIFQKNIATINFKNRKDLSMATYQAVVKGLDLSAMAD